MKQASQELLKTVGATEPRLRKISAPQSIEPLLPGGWSYRQLLGHLIDSASNNHQRFVRASLQTSLDYPAYDQAGNIRVQAAQEADWDVLITLWAAYNRYLAHVIAHLDASRLSTPCRIGADEPVTLEFLVNDYLVHLQHHLEQLNLKPQVG